MPDAPSASEVEEAKPEKGDVELASSPDANSANSSDADDKGDKKPETVLDHVTAHLEAEREAESPAAKEGKQEDESKDGEAEASKDVDAKPAEDKDDPPPFHEHPRWKEMVQEREGYKATIEDLTPKAERFDAMTDMMRDASLSSEEVSAGFNIMALMKGDPVKALEALKPYYTTLQTLVGETVPEDLRKQVETGVITEDAASELSRARAEAAVSRSQLELRDQRSTAADAERVQDAIGRAASEWEQGWKSNDPDYSLKVKLVESEIKAIMVDDPGRVPKTPEEAVQLSKDALAVVEATVKPFRPQKPEIKPPPDGSSVNANPAPKNSMEAASAALAAMGS